MNELAYHCTLYIRAENDHETMEEIAQRLERILNTEGLDFQYYDMELRNKDGETVDLK